MAWFITRFHAAAEIDARDRLPHPHGFDRMQLKAAMRFRSEHREQTGVIHRVVNDARKLPARLSVVGVFCDKGPDAVDRL